MLEYTEATIQIPVRIALDVKRATMHAAAGQQALPLDQVGSVFWHEALHGERWSL